MNLFPEPTAADIAYTMGAAMLDLTRKEWNPITPAIWGAFSSVRSFLDFQDSAALPLFQKAFAESMQTLITQATGYDRPRICRNVDQIIHILKHPRFLEIPALMEGMNAAQISDLMKALTSGSLTGYVPVNGKKRIYTLGHLENIMHVGVAVAGHSHLVDAFSAGYDQLVDDNHTTISVRLGALAQQGHLPIAAQHFQKVRRLLNPVDAMRPVPGGKGLLFQPVTHLAGAEPQ